MPVPRLLLIGLCALGLTLAGCDAATDDAGSDDGLPEGLSTSEDAAAVIADAVALQSGGALDDVANVAAMLGELEGARFDPDARPAGCEGSRTFDETTFVWTQSIDCYRGRPDGAFYAAFGREMTFAFFDADGEPVARPANAASLDFDIVSGTGIRRTPRASHELLSLGADLAFTGLHDDDRLVTVNGSYARSATDTLTSRNATRTLTYTLALELEDVTGPARRRGDGPETAPGQGPGRPAPGDVHWGQPVSGTISGLMTGLATYEGPRGTVEREIERRFTITFGGEGSSADARIHFEDGQTYTADAVTGELK